MPFIQAGSIRIYYEMTGNGHRLLFINGTGGDLRNPIGPMQSPLAKQFNLLAYDQRGLGQTDKPAGPYTMRDYADDAARLLNAVGWQSCHVLGYSFGGMVAQEFAIRHPGRVDRLVLCVTSPGGAGGASYPLHELAKLGPEERARRAMALADLRRTPEWQAAHPEEVSQFIGQSLAAERQHADEPGWAEGRARQLDARRGHDTFDRLDEIRAPTLICGGRYDGIALAATQERMAARIPGAELKIFEGGHLFVMQDRSAYPAIMDWLKRD
ncbi:alpha/beta fold hydrolase [Emcibacter sp. SYSU 3D8]|uniref:alpha/beta fold hydrolase n=1 Tax=Emcibacter sp. SYSU 3D8 TaxID=3133969 RepID=UPI0031FF3E47